MEFRPIALGAPYAIHAANSFGGGGMRGIGGSSSARGRAAPMHEQRLRLAGERWLFACVTGLLASGKAAAAATSTAAAFMSTCSGMSACVPRAPERVTSSKAALWRCE
jgi:hypothetical protein